MSEKLNTAIAVIGIDIGKNSFAVDGREQETRTVAQRQSSEPQRDQSTQSPPYDCKGRFPRLQWPIAPRHHVDRNRGLSDLDAELEQLAMDLGSAPQRGSQNSFFGSDRAPVPSQNFVHRRNLGDFRPRGAGNH